MIYVTQGHIILNKIQCIILKVHISDATAERYFLAL